MTQTLLSALDRRAAAGNPARLWLRDDDAVAPSAALERLLTLTGAMAVPLAIAAIPARSGEALARRLDGAQGVTVALHGWSHRNHAPAPEKKQELGAHRPLEQVLDELSRGQAHLAGLHGGQFCPVLVPPWNRISPEVTQALPRLGLRALSVFGAEKPAALPQINTHVDVMDWRGTGGGKPDAVLEAELLRWLEADVAQIGVLTHHLVHDDQVWRWLERLFTLTSGHPGCRWVGLPELLPLP